MKTKPVILVVDDEPQNIELLEAQLVPQGYDIIRATTGEEALKKLSGNQIDLILLDVLMPGMDGFEVIRRVRKDTTYRLLPIIMVTVLRKTEDRVKGIEAGCDDFISRPVDKMELLARVRSVLKAKAYDDLMSNYRKELESEVLRRTEELKRVLEKLQQQITERKQAEDQVKRLNRVYAVLGNINQAIVRIHDPHQLLDEVCRIAVDDGKFKLAWIGMVNPGTRKVEVVAFKGATDGYLDKITIDLNDDQRNSGPTGNAILTGMRTTSNDIEHDAIMLPWREYALRLGFRSSASFPLKVFGETRGAFSLYAAEVAFFDEDEMNLLNELAMDISFAIEINQQESERKRAREALRESEERYRTLVTFSPDALYVHVDGLVALVNPAFCQLLGADDPSQLIGKSVFEIVHPEFHEKVRGRQKLMFDGQLPPILEGKFIRLDGTVVDVEVRTVGIDWQGSKGAQVIARDITERKKAEESQLLLTTALESTANGVTITDLKGNIVWVNKAFGVMTGYTSKEVHGQNPRLLKSGMQDDSFYRSLWETILGGDVWRGELINKRKDGSLYTEEMTITPLKKENGEITHFIAIKQDATERRKAEAELRLMAQTVASAQDCISITDLENRLLFVNDAFRTTYGYTTKELLGKDVSVVRSPNTPAAITDRILHTTLAGGWHGEILNRRKDGSEFPVELWTSVVRDEAGTPVAMVGTARNISDRKVAEEHLKQSEEQFRLIAENVADMIAVLDLDGRRIYNSPSYRSILGDPESLKGTDGFQEIHPEDRDRVKQVFQETVRTGIGQSLEFRFERRDGSVCNIESKGSVIRDSDGRISQVIVVSRDVTEEKRLAAQFLRAQRMESIGTLAGGIAHDLNNVLAPIMMAIEVLRSKVSDPGGQKILSTIETSAKRGADIVRQVLAFGRGVEGDRILVQLKHIANEVVKIAGQTFPKSIEIRTDFPRDLWTVSADPTQMHQVLLNMLLNARDAMPKGGTLTISAENVTLDEIYSRMHPEAKPGSYVSLAITDTGTGIPEDIRERIFEPFFTTKEIGMGTGLGLSTTLAIVRSHKGFVNVYSELGKGTTFRVYIPAAGTASRVAAPGEDADLPTGNGELILIVDDEAAIREITKETLQAYGYKAMTASNGAEGVALFAENKKNIKVVITDIMMPVMDGTAAILVLKKIDPEVKIIAASGLTDNGKITTPSDSNVQAFLTKPYTAEKLLKALAAVLK